MEKIEKKKWDGVEHQSPAPKLVIYTKGDPKTADITFSPAGPQSKLLSYTFSEAVDDLEGTFSFTVEDEEIKNEGKSVFDMIPVRGIVMIYEGDVTPAFVGIIRRREIRKAMTSHGVKRSIAFSGKSIISCISEFTVSLDLRILGVSDVISKQQKLTTELAAIKEITIEDFMEKTWEHFKVVSKGEEGKVISATGIANVIEKFIKGDAKTFINAQNKQLHYNLACVFYSATTNVIVDVWRHILPDKVYELFAQCENGKPRVIARQAPFEPKDWSSLDIYMISPISLTAYDIMQSDNEVYTAFVSYIIGSAMSKEFYLSVNQTKWNDGIVQYNEDKQNIYGYRPLDITFSGYDREGNAEGEERDVLGAELLELNKMAKRWYSRLDEMYSGSITVITDFNEPKTNPRAGCRAGFMGGEFYIKKTEHSWNFGGTPTIKLTVSRGMVYDNGEMLKENEGIIKNVGGRFRELEKRKA